VALSKQLRILVLVFIPALLPTTSFADTLENYTFKLSRSTEAFQIWTTPPSERVFQDSIVPVETGAEIKVYAAKNEFEPFQVVVKPSASGNVAVSIGNFGAGISAEIYQVKYVNVTQATDSLGRTGNYPDPLWPVENGSSVSLTANQNTAFWFSLSVSKTAAAGDHLADVQIDGITIPVRLHVFVFAIPDELHVKSQMGYSPDEILSKYGVTFGDTYWTYLDKIKQFFIDHRLTPDNPVWPGGIMGSGGEPLIDYNCTTQTLSDPYGIWGFEQPANKYLNGVGFNDGVGFPSLMVARATVAYGDASYDPRPAAFCGTTKSESDWYTGNNPESEYNVKWFSYMKSLRDYLSNLGYLGKSYYYFETLLDSQAEYDAVAWYAQEIKKKAPDLKLLLPVSPRPEIYSHPVYTGAKIDIWVPVHTQYNPALSQSREKSNGEETWIYFLSGSQLPYFNPITLDHPGIESKLTGWFLWKYRIRGILHYLVTNWYNNPWTELSEWWYSGNNGDDFMLYPPSTDNTPIAYGSNNHRMVPSIRFELMRDSLEDYEYLYLLAGGRPEVGASNAADTQVNKIITGLTSYTRDSNFMYNLRRVIGLKLGNESTEIPDLLPVSVNPRAQGSPGNYYINFQDPLGQPTADPLVVDGKTYMKIGFNPYDQALGYGWYGDMAHTRYVYLDGPNELQKSMICDEWGMLKTFEFDLPKGTYKVTVSVGRGLPAYDLHNKIVIEGTDFVTDEATNPYIVRTKILTTAVNKLHMEMGIPGEITMLNYLDVEAVDNVKGDINCDGIIGFEDCIGILRIITGVPVNFPGCPLSRGDYNLDGKIGIEDLIALLQVIAELR
jgi:hypothetical protein